MCMRGGSGSRATTTNNKRPTRSGAAQATPMNLSSSKPAGVKKRKPRYTAAQKTARKRQRMERELESEDSNAAATQPILSEDDEGDKDTVINKKYVLRSNPERGNTNNMTAKQNQSKPKLLTAPIKPPAPRPYKEIAQHVALIHKELEEVCGPQWLASAEWRKEALGVLEHMEKKFTLKFGVSLESYLDPRCDPMIAHAVLCIRDIPNGTTENHIRKLFKNVHLTSVHIPLNHITGQPRGYAFAVFEKQKNIVDIFKAISPTQKKILDRHVKVMAPISQEALDPVLLRVKHHIDALRATIEGVNGTLLESASTINPFTSFTPAAAKLKVFTEKQLDELAMKLDKSKESQGEKDIDLVWEEEFAEDVKANAEQQKKIESAVDLDATALRRDTRPQSYQLPTPPLNKKARKKLKAEMQAAEAKAREQIENSLERIDRTPALVAMVEKAQELERVRFERRISKKVRKMRKRGADDDEQDDKLHEEVQNAAPIIAKKPIEKMTDEEIRGLLGRLKKEELRKEAKKAKLEKKKQERIAKKAGKNIEANGVEVPELKGKVKDLLDRAKAQLEGSGTISEDESDVSMDEGEEEEEAPKTPKRARHEQIMISPEVKMKQNNASFPNTASLRYFSGFKYNDHVLVEDRPLFHNLASYERRPVFRFARSRSSPSGAGTRYCMCCSEAGHTTSGCPWLKCELCSSNGDHFSNTCSEALIEFHPDTEGTIFTTLQAKASTITASANAIIPISCYSCGSDQHLGGDCPKYEHSSDQNPGIHCKSALREYGIVTADWEPETAARKYISDPPHVFDHSANARELFGFNFHPASFDQQPKKPPPRRQPFKPSHHVRYGNGR